MDPAVAAAAATAVDVSAAVAVAAACEISGVRMHVLLVLLLYCS